MIYYVRAELLDFAVMVYFILENTCTQDYSLFRPL